MTRIKHLNGLSFLAIFMLQSCMEPDTDSVWDIDRISILNTIGYCRSVAVVNDTAYVAAGQNGFQIWDMSAFLSTGTNPSLVAAMDSYLPGQDFGDISQVEYSEKHRVILAVESNSLVNIIDKIGSDSLNWDGAKMSDKTREIRVMDDSSGFTIYAADNDDGLKWNYFELQSWGEWSQTSGDEIWEAGKPTGIDRYGSLLAQTTDQTGVSLYQISNIKSDPVKVDSADTEGNADKVTLTDNGLFIGSEGGGAYYIPISGTSFSTPVQFAEDLYVTHVSVSGNTAVLSLASGGIALYDISNPSAPVSRGIHDIGYVYKTVHESSYILACTREGLQILSIKK